jgi:hypothetical protein
MASRHPLTRSEVDTGRLDGDRPGALPPPGPCHPPTETTGAPQFFEQTIAARNEFILPFHSGPVIEDEQVVALRAEIRSLLEQVLARGRRDGTIRPDATPIDIIITGAMLAQPLPNAADWDQLARRQARIFVSGLAATDRPLLRKDRPRE